jgi:hypothetical protein
VHVAPTSGDERGEAGDGAVGHVRGKTIVQT